MEWERIEILEGDNEIAEAEAISKKILDLTGKGYRFDDIAILARIYKLMPLIEVALIRHGIPYNSLDGFMYDRQDMKTLMAVMKFLLGMGSQGSIDLDILRTIKADLSMQDKTSSLEDAFDIANSYTLSGPKVAFLDEEAFVLRRFYLNSTGDLLHDYHTLSEFLDHVEEARRTNAHSPTGRVNLMTIHQAKGLEFKCVIVPGLNEGILPHVNSIEQVIMHIEEERRLMYVAMTRAMERLIITYRKRQTGEPITVASRFLKEIAP